MPTEHSDGASSFLLNPNVLLAVVTVASGVWIFTHKLSSNRPLPSSDSAQAFLGDQKLEARLWEDPLKGTGREDDTVDITVREIADRIRSRRESPEGGSRDAVLLLPVLLAGGRYSEDQESRIRSRYAIVSALGQAGYAPMDAEHIGSVRIPWLTQQELEKARSSTEELSALWHEVEWGSDARVWQLGTPVHRDSTHIQFRFEWYRPRTFARGSANHSRQDVLVLWLDETHFEDDPALRLALLLERLMGASDAPGSAGFSIGLIGPRRSSTLRRLLPDWEKKDAPLFPVRNASVRRLALRVLECVDVYAATPSAMDEVLIRHDRTEDLPPRTWVTSLLAKRERVPHLGLFKSFRNFASTDAQMAHGILDELALRGADLSSTENHMVLISEWDTFYARMLALTYRAELALRRKQPVARTRAAFVEDHRTGQGEISNLHSFVYLRGLDGQAHASSAPESKTSRDDPDAENRAGTRGKARPWEPDINLAEGQAQFDYLGRLGDRIEELKSRLRAQGHSHRICAIGIVGSDVYDTLLILQALRQRFSDVHFFTTDLDVRFLHPRERGWARNLIVASSYGLELHHSLQGTAAPFRDSAQTAQFSAALAALGNGQLKELRTIPPRIFEVGNGVAVDLSPPKERVEVAPLHPPTKVEAYAQGKFPWRPLLASFAAASLILFGLSWGWSSFRRLTWHSLAHLQDALTYREEDAGHPDDLEPLLRRLAQLRDSHAALWISNDSSLKRRLDTLAELRLERDRRTAEAKADPPGAEIKREDLAEALAGLDRKRETELAALMARFLDLLNQIIRQDVNEDGSPPPLPAAASFQYGGLTTKVLPYLRQWQATRRVVQRYESRRALDALLEAAHVPGDSEDESGPGDGQPAVVAAREAALGLFHLRCRRLVCFWISVFTFGPAALVLMGLIWLDTFHRHTGERFSLTDGISSWPAEVVRFIVVALAVCFIFTLAHRLREAFYALTRIYRLSKPAFDTDSRGVLSCVQTEWHRYREGSRFRRRWRKIFLLTLSYFGLLFAIFAVFDDHILRPVRGGILNAVDLTLLLTSIVSFLFLAMLTADAASRCRMFIERLSEQPTRYPNATHRHFRHQLGRIDAHYIDEWIDVQLIADLTEKVGRLVYYPAGLLVLLILARNSWWDRWPWPVVLVVSFSLNFMVALASVVILQRAAKRAKAVAENSLAAKVKRLQAQASPSAAQNNASQAEKLLDEIRTLRRGAFVPFWENPVVGAVFVSSGGTTLIQAFIMFMGR